MRPKYRPITDGEIEKGEPLSNSYLTKLKDNFENHWSRLDSIEEGDTTVYPPMMLRVNGYYADAAGAQGILKTTINFDLTITGVRLLIDRAGTIGTTEVDLTFYQPSGPWQSILSTRPSVPYTAGDDAISSNAVLHPNWVNRKMGDILALDITSAQLGAKNFVVRIDYIKT